METKTLIFATEDEDAHNYITELETLLKDAQNVYNEAKADADKKWKQLKQAESWETLLLSYIENVTKTDRTAQSIISEFDNAKKRSEETCTFASYSFQAFQWMLDDIIKITKCVEEYKAEIDECVNQLSGASDSDPLKAGLKALQQAVNEALVCLLAALEKWLSALDKIEMLFRRVGDQSGDSLGMDAIINALCDDFVQAIPHIPYDNFTAWTTCSAPPRPKFPLVPTDENCKKPAYKNLYACKTKHDLDEVQTCMEDLRKDYDDAAIKMVKAQTSIDALEAALKAAREANACKTK